MTITEFNNKYSAYLEEGFYGLDIDNEKVIDFLDNQFEEIIKTNMQPFLYSQIKLKWGYCHIYCNALPALIRHLENEVDKILKKENNFDAL